MIHVVGLEEPTAIPPKNNSRQLYNIITSFRPQNQGSPLHPSIPFNHIIHYVTSAPEKNLVNIPCDASNDLMKPSDAAAYLSERGSYSSRARSCLLLAERLALGSSERGSCVLKSGTEAKKVTISCCSRPRALGGAVGWRRVDLIEVSEGRRKQEQRGREGGRGEGGREGGRVTRKRSTKKVDGSQVILA